MFAVPLYIAALMHPDHAEVLRPFEDASDALAQAYAWTRGTTLVDVTTPGYLLYATFADGTAHVRVEAHTLALAEPGDDEAVPLALDPDPEADAPAHLVTRAEWDALRRVRAARADLPREEN